MLTPVVRHPKLEGYGNLLLSQGQEYKYCCKTPEIRRVWKQLGAAVVHPAIITVVRHPELEGYGN